MDKWIFIASHLHSIKGALRVKRAPWKPIIGEFSPRYALNCLTNLIATVASDFSKSIKFTGSVGVEVVDDARFDTNLI